MLMKWVYTDQAEIPNDEAFLIELVKAAKKFRLKELKERQEQKRKKLSLPYYNLIIVFYFMLINIKINQHYSVHSQNVTVSKCLITMYSSVPFSSKKLNCQIIEG